MPDFVPVKKSWRCLQASWLGPGKKRTGVPEERNWGRSSPWLLEIPLLFTDALLYRVLFRMCQWWGSNCRLANGNGNTKSKYAHLLEQKRKETNFLKPMNELPVTTADVSLTAQQTAMEAFYPRMDVTMDCGDGTGGCDDL